MKTVTIQIGNTDDKLTQRRWSEFIVRMDHLVHNVSSKVHFHGGSAFDSTWQNVAWVFEMGTNLAETGAFTGAIEELRKRFNQDSVAVTIGETQFV